MCCVLKNMFKQLLHDGRLVCTGPDSTVERHLLNYSFRVTVGDCAAMICCAAENELGIWSQGILTVYFTAYEPNNLRLLG